MHVYFYIVACIIIISVSGVDAFQITPLRPNVIYKSSHHNGGNKLPIQMTARNSESNNKSLFEQAFGMKMQFPWESDDSPSSAQKSDSASPPKQRKPRVPRYPTALQIPTEPPGASLKSGKGIDEYVQSAMTAAKEMNVNGNNSKNDVKSTEGDFLEKEPDRGKRDPLLGILLIDHGSKRKASNDHLHSIAEQYHSSLASVQNSNNIVVKAAHMEIAEPSILTTLRNLIVEEKVTKVVCVPYFLSPGKHATIDVPNLIAEAIEILGDEQMLDYDGGVVEITSSKALGTNVESMLGVVDALVERRLDEDGVGELFHLQRHSNGAETIIDTNTQDNQDEVRKYMNRVTLLERMLQAKVDGLNKMTNRVTVLEDVVQKLKAKMKTEQENMIQQQQDLKEEATAQVTDLTDKINTLSLEKKSLNEEIDELSLQQQLVEKSHNATVTKLKETVESLENEIQLQIEQANDQKRSLAEISSKGEEEMNKRARQQDDKVKQLQTQLADLLDAYNELEQLHADTEGVVTEYKDQLKRARETFHSELAVEEEKKEDYKAKWNELQLQLKEERDEATRLLQDKEAEFEGLLESEKNVSNEWKMKWETLRDERAVNATDTSSYANATGKTDDEWNAQLEEAMAASAATIEDLTQKLQQQQEEYETTISRREEQQKQLQQYLQAELQTYYKTIQNQTAQLDSYKMELEEMESKQEESMLIATNSVEASQKREVEMLNTIEELESELSMVRKENENGERLLRKLQDELTEMKMKAVQSEPPPTPLDEEIDDSHPQGPRDELNEDLREMVEQLQSQVQAMASEMKTSKFENAKENDQSITVKSPRSKVWRRRILRPWTVFRSRKSD